MKILITGAGGYIGSHLAEHLAAEGHEVTALMRKTSPRLSSHPTITIIEAPNYHQKLWDGAALKGQDVVIHAASRVHYREKGRNAATLYKSANIGLSLQVAEASARAGVKRFLFLSSIGAKLLEDRFHEGRVTHAEAWKDNPYRMSKLEAERALLALASPMAVSCLRLPMVYGQGAPGSFHTLTNLIRKRVPLPFGAFTGERAFISIETVKAFVSFYMKEQGADGKTWAIRDKDEISPRMFALCTAAAAHVKAPMIWDCPEWLLKTGAAMLGFSQSARSLAEPVHVDLESVQRKLGWYPQLTVAEGLQKAFS